MKVVINTCYGGFRISTTATKELIKRGCKAIITESAAEYYGDYKTTFKQKDVGDGYTVEGPLESVLRKDGVVYWFDNSKRTDPDLIAVVESLGNAASASLAELKIVEIPDGIEWEIDEYDGRERVEESHRSWE